MQQTALNILAVSIFLMTLSILLGPLIHLSPTIPAVLTFCVLGIVTVDTLGLKGRGATLLLDGLARFSPEYRDRAVYHEAGHFLVAYLLGIPVKGYTLSAWETLKQGQPGIGGVVVETENLFEGVLSPLELQLLLDRLCTVWMAGIAAEVLRYERAEGGKEDRQQITNALVFFGRSASESPRKQQWGQLKAKTLIEKHRNAYEALVRGMIERKPVPECYRLIQQHVPDTAQNPS
ncbi:ATP-dependent Zn protease [Lusitaniella coriacea]|uniref:ATP-dependent Zn protease n=1 Tax=Lusitaniella coriacea TaxID=1983105 RepID=UPI003CE7A661